jgi:hypothetical protein
MMKAPINLIDSGQRRAFPECLIGAAGFVVSWEGRPWVVILRQDGHRLVTTDPTAVRTVATRRGGGR